MSEMDPQVSHVDLYHKLGKLEGILESMMASVSSFQSAVKDIHARIDALEDRQIMLEKRQSLDRGANNALTHLAKDFAIPVLAIAITWLVSRSSPAPEPQLSTPSSSHQQQQHGILGSQR